MHTKSMALLPWIVAALALAGSVEARDRCASTCREAVRACISTACAAVAVPERAACREDCRGRHGCPAHVRTLAYTVARCRTEADGRFSGEQTLWVRRGDCDPVRVLTLRPVDGISDGLGLCPLVASNLEGLGSVLGGAFQRLGVTPDGSGVVFEVNDAHTLIPWPRTGAGLIPSDVQRGFFYVRADGSDLRFLGPPSADPTFRVGVLANGQPTANFQAKLPFSPSGRQFVHSDLDADGVVQLVTVDVKTGERTQVTNLPPVPPSGLAGLGSDRRHTTTFVFSGEHTIDFLTRAFSTAEPAVLEGFALRLDIGELRRLPLRNYPSEAIGDVEERFSVGGPEARVLSLLLEGTPANPANGRFVSEVFRVGPRGLVQLTSLGRAETEGFLQLAGSQRVLLMASATTAENPNGNCQLFSVGDLGGTLRQITRFDAGEPSVNGCDWAAPPGCAFRKMHQDPRTKTLVFNSNCAPFGSNPLGAQIFAMRPDGTRLRQLTNTAGARFEPDGAVEVEMVGHVEYSTTTALGPSK